MDFEIPHVADNWMDLQTPRSLKLMQLETINLMRQAILRDPKFATDPHLQLCAELAWESMEITTKQLLNLPRRR